jgi:hypothetical protein
LTDKWKNIVDLWSGSIHTPDFALQLLLLIGYVFDWARDSYREDIIDELRVLASRGNDPIRCLDTDTDLSPASHFAPSEQFSPRGGDDESEGYITAEENLTILDSVKGDR